MSSLDSAETLSETKVAQTLNEDWLSVAIGLAVFALALGSLAGADLLGWVVSTSVWTDPGKALGAVSKARRLQCLCPHLSRAPRGLDHRRPCAESGRPPVCRGVHGRLLDRLCKLDHRIQCLSCRGHARGLAEIRHRLVAQADQRGRVHRCSRGRPHHRELRNCPRLF